jgi:uncharacterized protein YaiI (UPF0178 family)
MQYRPAVAKGGAMTEVRILVDADACPVKDEIYKVAWRRGVPVKIVSNARIRVPEHELIERVVVSDGFDAADDWIAEAAGAIAMRAIMADLRSGAGVTGGPAPFAKADRSRFLQALDEALVRLARA